jgi:hypothetical protein
MLPPSLRSIPLLIAVDPHLEQLMPTVYRRLARRPWQVEPFGPAGGGGHGPADDRPRVLAALGDRGAASFARAFREARPRALLLVVATAPTREHLRQSLSARVGADDVFSTIASEEDRLLTVLTRSTIARTAGGDEPSGEHHPHEIETRDALLDGIIAMLRRDPCPPWRVAELYRRMAAHERTVERHAKTVPMKVAALHRARQMQRVSSMRRAGLTSGNRLAARGALDRSVACACGRGRHS